MRPPPSVAGVFVGPGQWQWAALKLSRRGAMPRATRHAWHLASHTHDTHGILRHTRCACTHGRGKTLRSGPLERHRRTGGLESWLLQQGVPHPLLSPRVRRLSIASAQRQAPRYHVLRALRYPLPPADLWLPLSLSLLLGVHLSVHCVSFE